MMYEISFTARIACEIDQGSAGLAERLVRDHVANALVNRGLSGHRRDSGSYFIRALSAELGRPVPREENFQAAL